jgi:hypothetical protein
MKDGIRIIYPKASGKPYALSLAPITFVRPLDFLQPICFCVENHADDRLCVQVFLHLSARFADNG